MYGRTCTEYTATKLSYEYMYLSVS
eukprot:SAG31_NODE_17547_length_666_cov_232.250441_1_plen_24_part_10